MKNLPRVQMRPAALAEILPLIDYAWICRPELFEKYAASFRLSSRARLLYDTIDLHFVRKKRQIAALGGDAEEWRVIQNLELTCAGTADATIVVSELEQRILKELGVRNVFVIPTIHDKKLEGDRPFAGSSGLLFIGNYNHGPNRDAAEWLCREIMPMVWKQQPHLTITLLGSNPPASIRDLSSSRVRVPGYVSNVEPYFLNSRGFIAPLRFGAGLKGKVGQAISYGLPVVATDIAVEGFGLTNELNCLIANEPQGLAAAILRLMTDEDLWRRLSRTALGALQPFGSEHVGNQATSMLKMLSNAESPASLH